MTRRALVLGAATGELTGVDHDVTAMQEILAGRGFEVRTLTGAAATRDGMLAGYEQLIQDSAAGDAAFVYYSGHGGSARAQDPGRAIFPFIVPTDFDRSGPADFRGILATELSVLLARLLQRTADATVMLDCCHAAHMSRDPRLRPRALKRLTYLDVEVHRQRQLAAGLDVSLLDPLGNRAAVRLVACGPDASAYELPNDDGVTCGIFTDAFRVALAEAGELPVTWATLMARIRGRVLALAPEQRPEVEGDESSRLLFGVERAEPAAVPITGGAGGRAVIPAAALLGIGVGDTFAVLPAGAALVDDAAVLATATVDRMAGATAQAAVKLRGGLDRLPLGAVAFPTGVAAARRPVRLHGDEDLLAPLRAELETAPLVRAAEPGDDAVLASVLAEVGPTGAGLLLHDAAGPLARPAAADPAGVRRVLADLGGLARAAALRALRADTFTVLNAPVTVEWGRVVDGQPAPAAGAGELMHAGDSFYVRVRNNGGGRVWIYLYDIGVTAAVSLLTDDSPGGLPLFPGDEFVLGDTEFGGLEGLGLTWPDDAPRETVRPEALLVVVTSAPQDLSALQQPAIGRRETATGDLTGGSPLQQLLTQITTGGRRAGATGPAGGAAVRYATHVIAFQLSADPAPAREVATFLLDERPNNSVLLLGDRGTPGVADPVRVVVRPGELVVRRAVLGPAIRVDALVRTCGDGDGDGAGFRAATVRFGGVSDGDRLSLDPMVLELVPGHGVLDLRVWVSPDNGPDLADLLTATTGLAEMRTATTGLVDTAQAQLAKNAGDTVGLYAGAFLAGEGFGAGRHPATGDLTAGDFAFHYRIDPLS